MEERCTEKAKVKMGRGAPKKNLVLEMGSADYRNSKNTRTGSQTTLKTVQCGYKQHKIYNKMATAAAA